MVNLERIETLMDVCAMFGGCPQCAQEAGIHSDTPASAIKKILDTLPKSENAVSHKGTWVYFCEDHMRKDENYEEFQDIELEQGEEVRDLYQEEYQKEK